MSGFKPPKPYEPGNQPAENWERWKQKFHFYADAIDLETKSKGKQISHLMNTIGDVGLALYNVMPERASLLTTDAILDAISKHYEPYKNTTYVRHVFFSECQTEEQTIEDFVTVLRMKVKDCEFGVLTESLIKDRLIGGIRDCKMRERLLKEHNLTLDKAINLCRADENSKKQSQAMASEEKVNAIKAKYNEHKGGYQNRAGNKKYNENPRGLPRSRCSRCGTSHKPGMCPANGQTCYKCQRPNHYASVCKAKFRPNGNSEIHAVEHQSSESEDDFSIDTLEVNSIRQKSGWLQRVRLQNIEVTFKLDTGSEVNLITTEQYNKIKPRPKLYKITKTITAYTGHSVPLIGTCQILCAVKDKSQVMEFYVGNQVRPPILGINACEGLKLIERIDILKQKNQTAIEIIEQFRDVFQGMGKLQNPYQIKLEEGATPQIVPARKLPLSLKTRVKEEIDRMVKEGILIKEEGPTDWVQPIVIVKKPNGSLRICMDPRHLNKFIKREHFPIPTSESVFVELGGAKIFTVLDVSSAFWQIPLTEDSSRICTIATPFGRYRFTRVPFGIKSAPEVLQKQVNSLTEGMEGVINYMDDILVYGADEAEHNQRLIGLLERSRVLNFKFSKDKLQLAVKSIKFLGYQITPNGIQVHQSKIEAIGSMDIPTNKIELQRFLGMINFLGKHIPNLSDITYPLRQLLHKNNEFVWTCDQQQAFESLKKLVTSAPVLAFYNKDAPTTLSVDASQYGLGAVLLQNDRPVAYASVALTPTQMKYPQIEKEFLAITWGCEHFHFYLYASDFTIETDHKPLVGIVKKPIEKLSPRLQRLLIRFIRYNPKLKYVPGKLLYTADSLSRAPNSKCKVDTDFLQGETMTVHTIVSVTDPKRQALIEDTAKDNELQAVKLYIQQGWPDTKTTMQGANAYWHCRDELHESDGLFFRGDRLIIPQGQRKQVLKTIHQAHQGVISCQKKAKQAVYWPGMTAEIRQLVLSCPTCLSYSQANQKEPLMPHPIPSLPWDKVGVDFGKVGKKNFILVTDYHSKFIVIRELQSATASSVINELRQIFATHGIPTILISDNGPPFDANAMKVFFASWDIAHATSSPRYPKSNGMVERAIGTAKGLLIKAYRSGRDPFMAILEHNATPKNNLPTPAEMLMGRRVRTLLPTGNRLRRPLFPTFGTWKTLQKQQRDLKKSYDESAKKLKPLSPGQSVMIQKSHRDWAPGKVISKEDFPRSYRVISEDGSNLRRNRSHLRPYINLATPDKAEKREENKLGVSNSEAPRQIPPDLNGENNDKGSDTGPQEEAQEQTNHGKLSTSPGRAIEKQVTPIKMTRSGRHVVTPSRYKD